MKKLIVPVGLLFGTILLCLFMAERVMRIFYAVPESLLSAYYPLQAATLGKTIHIRQYEFETEHRYNRQGFREDDVLVKKKEGVRRILFIGDSFTEGFGVSEESRFSNKLIHKLGKGFESVNVGQLATNPDHYFNNLIRFGIALRPDFVVMGVFLGNDFQGGRGIHVPDAYTVNSSIPSSNPQTSWRKVGLTYLGLLLRQAREKKRYLSPRWGLKGKNFWDLYYGQKITKTFRAAGFGLSEDRLDDLTKGFDQEILQKYYQGLVNSGVFNESIRNQQGLKEAEPYYIDADYENTLSFIKESAHVCEKNNIGFLLVILPDINQVHPDEFRNALRKHFILNQPPSRFKELELFRSRLGGDLRVLEIPYVDTTSELRNAGSMSYFLFDNHMNELGHDIVSQVIYRKIRPMMDARSD